MAKILESKVEACLVKRVKALGGEIRKVQWIGRRGAPDRFVMLPHEVRLKLCDRGLPYRNPWVELKRPGVAVEDYQQREHERMARLGETVLVIDTLDLVDFYFPLSTSV